MLNKRPNIFDYAKKELSQDAVVCWLLKCCHSKCDAYRKTGLDFIRFIIEDESVAENDIELEKDSPHAQYYHMDVYANIRVGDKIIPVIFEDKTDTFLHGNQELRYTEMVNTWKEDKKWTKELFDNAKLKWSENTRYVFFKTGYVFNWQKEEIENLKIKINAKIRTIYVEDMLEFIRKHKDIDILLNDYYVHLQQRQLELQQSQACRCDRYFKKIFGDNHWFEYSYQQWGSRNFAYINDQHEENRLAFTIRTGWKKNGQESAYYIGFMQYRNEKMLRGNNTKKKQLTEQRRAVAEEIKDICYRICSELGRQITIEDNMKNRIPHQNYIFRVFIDNEKENSEDDVCAFFKEFINKFNLAAKEAYKSEYVIC